MTEVVAALIWDKDKFMICQRPATKSCALLWEFVGGNRAEKKKNVIEKLKIFFDRFFGIS